MKRIRCPIHGFIRFSDNERKVIDHPLFRRLRHIRQLALTELVYPGATHTRFEHSLGVMEAASRAFDRLMDKCGGRMEEVFKTVEGFEQQSLAKARQVLRLGALLHDIGHAPFCHAAEDVYFERIDPKGKHAALGARILREDLTGFLDNLYWHGCSGFVANMIDPKGEIEFPRQFKILLDLVSGEMDADRTDYLLRDSYHCGVDYGRFDYERMIECLEIHEPEVGTLEVALNRDGIHTFEALILARYHMNVQVYYHRVRRIYDHYLKKYHEALGDQCPKTKEQILAQNDFAMMAQVMGDSEKANGEAKFWADKICKRKHDRVVFDSTFNADAKMIMHAKTVLDALRKEFPSGNFTPDEIEPVSIHRQMIPGDSEEAGLELYLTGLGKPDRSMGEESPIIRGMPRKFQCYRIYSDVEPENEKLRDEMTGFAFKKYQELGGR